MRRIESGLLTSTLTAVSSGWWQRLREELRAADAPSHLLRGQPEMRGVCGGQGASPGMSLKEFLLHVFLLLLLPATMTVGKLVVIFQPCGRIFAWWGFFYQPDLSWPTLRGIHDSNMSAAGATVRRLVCSHISEHSLWNWQLLESLKD